MFTRKKQPATAVDVTPPAVAAESIPQPEPVSSSSGAGQDAEGEAIVPTRTGASTATTHHEYPTGLKLVLLMMSLFMSMFLVALDRLIISTAIPQITDDFHSVTDIGWYGSAYLLSTCAFQLLFGKLYTFYSIKVTFLGAVGLFEVGSAICGAAPNSVSFIIGRAIAGVGAAGIFSGAIVIIVYAVPLHKRPLFQGLFGAIFGVASVVGPLLGGTFTSKITWRWCFYINLPLGGVAMVFLFFLLQIPDRDETKISTRAKLSQLDAVGTSVLIPGSVCLLLALQWGGLEYEWGNWRIILCLVLAFLLLLSFVAVQILMPKTATMPPRIFMQRSILAGFYSTMCIGSQMMIFVYFVPIWFQAIQGVSAVDSGIRMLPLVLGMVVASILTGILTTRIGYYTPFMLAGVCQMSIGAGLLTTLQVDTPRPQWIGYQFLYGWGLGCTFQAPNLAAQTVLPRADVPIGTSLMFFSQLLGGAIFISVGQNVLNNQLLQRLSGLKGFDPSVIMRSGATTLTHLDPSVRGFVLHAYNESLRKVFQVGLILTCLTIFGAAALEWRSVKVNQPKKPSAEEGTVGAAAKGEGEGEGKDAGIMAEKVEEVRDSDSERTRTAVAGERQQADAAEMEKDIRTT